MSLAHNSFSPVQCIQILIILWHCQPTGTGSTTYQSRRIWKGMMHTAVTSVPSLLLRDPTPVIHQPETQEYRPALPKPCSHAWSRKVVSCGSLLQLRVALHQTDQLHGACPLLWHVADGTFKLRAPVPLCRSWRAAWSEWLGSCGRATSSSCCRPSRHAVSPSRG